MSNKKTKYNRKKLKRNRKKTKYNRKSKRNKKLFKQKGGFRKQITDDVIRFFQNPHRVKRDCCPCVFKFLGMPEQTVNEMIEMIRNDKEKLGITPEYIINGFNRVYPNHVHTFYATDNISDLNHNQASGLIKNIWNSIPNGFAAIGGYRRLDGGGHCVVFAKDKQGELLLFDVQVTMQYVGIENIINYFRENYISKLYMLNSIDKHGKPLILDVNGHIINI